MRFDAYALVRFSSNSTLASSESVFRYDFCTPVQSCDPVNEVSKCDARPKRHK